MDMNKVSTRKSREEELDLEIEEEMKRFNPEPEKEEDTELPTKSKEEESWKKRYSDLRRYASQKEAELQKEIEDREKKLSEKAAREEGVLPKVVDKETVLKWKRDYPDVFGIVASINQEVTEAATSDIKKKLEDIEAERLELSKTRAMNEVLAAHPDFMDLRETDEFQNWLSEHGDLALAGDPISEAIHYALWENDTDSRAAIRAINIYKAEKNKKPTRKSEEDIASGGRRSNAQAPAESDGKRRYKESEIEKMSSREYDQFEDDIDAARREGRIIYDISAAGR